MIYFNHTQMSIFIQPINLYFVPMEPQEVSSKLILVQTNEQKQAKKNGLFLFVMILI